MKKYRIVQDLANQGLTRKEIAERTGFDSNSLRKLLTFAPSIRSQESARERYWDIAEDYRDGMPVADILAKYKITKATVYNARKFCGVPSRRKEAEKC